MPAADPVVDLLAIRARAEAAKNSLDRSHIWEDSRDVPALLSLVDSLMVERDLARDVAANLEAEAARNGICGHLAPTLAGGTALPVCELRAGHEGWHEADDGCKWSESMVGLAQQEQT